MSSPLQLSKNDVRYLGDFVRAEDMDRYLSILLGPRPLKPALLSLAAFNAELARIPLVTNEPGLAAIRYEWWRNALEEAEEKTGNPVADGLNAVIKAYDLPIALAQKLIDNHERFQGEIENDFVDADLTFHAPLFELMARLLGEEGSSTLHEFSEAASIACTAARLLSDEGEGLSHLARLKSNECQHLMQEMNERILPAFLPVSLTEFYLNTEYDDPARQLKRIWTLWRAKRTKKLVRT